MEQVGHRVHENLPRFSPPQRLLYLFGHEAQVEPLLVRMSRDASEPFRERLGVTVFTARAELRAATYRVPGALRPSDGGLCAHIISLSFF